MPFKRMTTQRVCIHEALCACREHPTAQTIFDNISGTLPNISLKTVYRNLNSLAADGVILRITVPNQPDRFDSNIHDHYHISCTGCGRFFDLSLPFDRGLLSRVEEESGFSSVNSDIIFKGICKNCNKE